MATTLTFRGVLGAGFSFIRVTACILGLAYILGAAGVLIQNTGDAAVTNELKAYDYFAFILYFFGFVILVAGFIGLGQKLLSDAFHDGFQAAKNGSAPTYTSGRMGVKATLVVGVRLLSIIILTFLSTAIFLGIGMSMISGSEDSTVLSLLGGFFGLIGILISFAMTLGLSSRVFSEAIAYGASQTGVFSQQQPDGAQIERDILGDQVSTIPDLSQFTPQKAMAFKAFALLVVVALLVFVATEIFIYPTWFCALGDWIFSGSTSGLALYYQVCR